MKIDRQAVYTKYDGHCAYCGKEITIKEMEVDHLHPQRNGGTDDMDNLMPSCHTCNHYKRANSLDNFRDWLLGGLIDRLMKVYIFRVALRYNMITINGWDKKFYFERKDKAMIKEATYYEMYCDRCGKQLDDGDIVAYKEKEGLEFVASESEWQTIEGKHYCPDCYEVDEETDEYVPKEGVEK